MAKIEVRLNPDVIPAGSDLSIVNAARRSFNKRSEWEYCLGEICGDKCDDSDGTKGVCPRLKEKDKRLLHFLARGMTVDDFHKFSMNFVAPDTEEHYKELVEKLWEWRNTPTHDTPFNHTFISFEVKAPIFVSRQLVKHEYLIMSEFSRRYITDDIEFYEPIYWRKAAPNKKQGSLKESVKFLRMQGFGEQTVYDGVFKHQMHSLDLYRDMIEAGVAPEQARMVLPQSTMTEWTWSGTLGAFAKMCRERLHPDAQYETRLVAKQVYDYLKQYYPVAAPALVEGPDV